MYICFDRSCSWHTAGPLSETGTAEVNEANKFSELSSELHALQHLGQGEVRPQSLLIISIPVREPFDMASSQAPNLTMNCSTTSGPWVQQCW